MALALFSIAPTSFADAEFGEALFSEVAYQFSVLVYRSQLGCDQTLVRLRDVIEQEKPAHASYHLCVIEPLLRVGFQARVGVEGMSNPRWSVFRHLRMHTF